MRTFPRGALLAAALLCAVATHDRARDSGPGVSAAPEAPQLVAAYHQAPDAVLPTFTYEQSGAIASVGLALRSPAAPVTDAAPPLVVTDHGRQRYNLTNGSGMQQRAALYRGRQLRT